MPRPPTATRPPDGTLPDLPAVAPNELPVPDDLVEWADRLVAKTGLDSDIEEWIAKATGRPRTEITVRGFLVAFVLVVTVGQPPLLQHVEAMAYRRIPRRWRIRYRTERPAKTPDASYKNIRDMFHRVAAAMDPSPLPKNRRLTWEQLETARAANELTLEEQTEAHRRLRAFSDRLLQASFETLPRNVRRRWEGSVALDGTKVPSFAVGRDRRGVWESTDPDAAWHVRSKTLDSHGLEPGQKAPEKAEYSWGYEATLAVMGYDRLVRPPEHDEHGRVVRPGDERPFPLLCLALSLHKPSHAPGDQAVSALRSVLDPGRPLDPDQPPFQPGWLGADRGFTASAHAADFHGPVRDLGYRIVMDYRSDELGRQHHAHGAVMVEGTWYCPSMPDPLVDAAKDRRAGTITAEQFEARIAARAAYRLKRYDAFAPGRTRWTCPATGTAPTCKCPLRRKSLAVFGKPMVNPSHLPPGGDPPPVCAQKTVSITDDPTLRWAQQLAYRSPEWDAVYHSLRNSVEGFNGTVKDPASSALEDPRTRRVRGLAPQWMLCSFLLLAENLRRVREWAAESTVGDDGVLVGPPKTRRAGRRARDVRAWEAERERREAAGLPVRRPKRQTRPKRRDTADT